MSGAVELLDARWIIKQAKAGRKIIHRQGLPKEAFLSLAELVKATKGPGPKWIRMQNFLPVIALSYPWLTKDHPDPDGANLRRVAKALKALLSHPRLSRLGVFWDFGSLYQHPDPDNGVMRTEGQNELFKQGLGCLGTLYSHPHTVVLRLTTFPAGYKKEDQPESTNVAEYFDRGWCFTESSWASLTKASWQSLDLGQMRDEKKYGYTSRGYCVEYCFKRIQGLFVGPVILFGCLPLFWAAFVADFLPMPENLIDECIVGGGRRPPLLPSQFVAELETKSFTNGKDDKPLVKRLYEAAFEEQFGKATVLDYGGLGWGDLSAKQLADVLATGAAPQLKTLYLHGNHITDEGALALAAALGTVGAFPQLERLRLDDNHIKFDGLAALATALGKEGAAPMLKERELPVKPPPPRT